MSEYSSTSRIEFPADGSLAEKVSALVSIAGRAPSAHNVQPWECRLAGRDLHFARDDARALTVGDPTGRETALSLAMFIETFAIAARRWGIGVEIVAVATTPGDEVLAIARIGKEGQATEDALYDAIWRRRTDRRRYAAMSCPSFLDGELASLTAGTEARLHAITEPSARARIATLAGRGMATALELTTMRRELSHLTYWDGEDATTGMALEALIPGASRNGSPAGAWFRANVHSYEHGVHVTGLFSDAPVLVVVDTAADDPAAWLDAGRVGCRVMLRAAVDGHAHDVCAAPVELPTLAPLLAAETDPTRRPQLLMRVGTPLDVSSAPPLSVRRPVAVTTIT